MRLDMLKRIACKKCKQEVYKVNEDGLCPGCQETIAKMNTINPLCKTCNKRCNQTALIEIVKCPRYDPKIAFKAPDSPVETRSTFPAVLPLAKKSCPKTAKKRGRPKVRREKS